jgi:hypothetical protein
LLFEYEGLKKNKWTSELEITEQKLQKNSAIIYFLGQIFPIISKSLDVADKSFEGTVIF